LEWKYPAGNFYFPRILSREKLFKNGDSNWNEAKNGFITPIICMIK
jgi:hypothetical protein